MYILLNILGACSLANKMHYHYMHIGYLLLFMSTLSHYIYGECSSYKLMKHKRNIPLFTKIKIHTGHLRNVLLFTSDKS